MTSPGSAQLHGRSAFVGASRDARPDLTCCGTSLDPLALHRGARPRSVRFSAPRPGPPMLRTRKALLWRHTFTHERAVTAFGHVAFERSLVPRRRAVDEACHHARVGRPQTVGVEGRGSRADTAATSRPSTSTRPSPSTIAASPRLPICATSAPLPRRLRVMHKPACSGLSRVFRKLIRAHQVKKSESWLASKSSRASESVLSSRRDLITSRPITRAAQRAGRLQTPRRDASPQRSNADASAGAASGGRSV